MPTVTLTRIVRPRTVCEGGRVYIESNVKTCCINFQKSDGNSISVAFDGRFDSEVELGGVVRETYTLYRDCPVKTDEGDRGATSDLQAMIDLRDALIAMDLTPRGR
jgi:hypothetical protein